MSCILPVPSTKIHPTNPSSIHHSHPTKTFGSYHLHHTSSTLYAIRHRRMRVSCHLDQFLASRTMTRFKSRYIIPFIFQEVERARSLSRQSSTHISQITIQHCIPDQPELPYCQSSPHICCSPATYHHVSHHGENRIMYTAHGCENRKRRRKSLVGRLRHRCRCYGYNRVFWLDC
jgi:hypothetical protein